MKLAVLATVVSVALVLAVRPATAQSENDWVINQARILITITPDGEMKVVEDFDVDFGLVQKHGIFRDLVTKQKCEPPDPEAEANCPSGHNRKYPISVEKVTANGQDAKWKLLTESNLSRIKIGDPDKTVRGEQAYHIEYRVRGALNAFTDHDELYWNVIGEWPVPIEKLNVQLSLPGSPALNTVCYQGPTGSTQRCRTSSVAGSATFTPTRTLGSFEQMTIVAGWPKGVVNVQPPVLEDPITFRDLFTLDAWEWGGMAAVAVLTLIGLAWAWWRFGRDRAYKSLYYLTNDPREGTRPLLGRQDIVIEYLPPDGLRPAQMGVILDERADTLDVTATIIDLAVRKHLFITEIPKKGWFGKRDWKLTRTENTEDQLLPWENDLLEALFKGKDGEVLVSSLKNTFYKELAETKDDLYADAMAHRWFRMGPTTSRNVWRLAGVGVMVAGGLLAAGSGVWQGRLLIPTPLAVGGLLLFMGSSVMMARTATGSEALRRVLGFRLYVATAEQRLQEFNEQQNIFARYLPYAMVFGCVEKWAKAFEKMGLRPETETAGWYSGTRAFRPLLFASDMRSFSGSVSSAISSTPGGSGGSGFGGGGSSGGGGGGGGGGSW